MSFLTVEDNIDFVVLSSKPVRTVVISKCS